MTENNYHKLIFDGISYHFINDYIKTDVFSNQDTNMAFKFAYDMSFGHKGEHREYRSGGVHLRTAGEIFANTFQGKLAEIAFLKYYKKLFPNNTITKVDFDCWEKGVWDFSDFITVKENETQENLVAIKSIKHFSHLLLLETRDWNNEGFYIPNKCKYNSIVLIKIFNNFENNMKKNKILYSDELSFDKLQAIVFEQEEWNYQVVGFLSINNLIKIIRDKQIIPQGSFLGVKMTKMDAENYYVQDIDLESF